MATNLSTSLPDVILAPGTTITVTFDDASTLVTKLNVYGFTPANVPDEEPEDFAPLFTYGRAQ